MGLNNQGRIYHRDFAESQEHLYKQSDKTTV